jgi:hypothetical protein
MFTPGFEMKNQFETRYARKTRQPRVSATPEKDGMISGNHAHRF